LFSIDWNLSGKLAIDVAFSMAVAVFLVFRVIPEDPEKVQMAVFSNGCLGAYLFPHLLLCMPRQLGLLRKVLLRTTAVEFISMKYVSALSMTLFVVSLPGCFLHDALSLARLNCGALLLTTIGMSASVVSASEGASLIALLLIWVPYEFFPEHFEEPTAWITAHPDMASTAALCAIPFIVLCSTLLFRREAAKIVESKSSARVRRFY
jgi:hypothetical protein